MWCTISRGWRGVNSNNLSHQGFDTSKSTQRGTDEVDEKEQGQEGQHEAAGVKPKQIKIAPEGPQYTAAMVGGGSE